MTATGSDPGAARQPVVVLGFPRSGATLLGRIFDAHPEVSCPPETNLLSACGRFLRESWAEGPPLGVLSGLALAGMPEEEVLAALRDLVFSIQARLAAGKPVWMEKSGFDIFYLEEIERLLGGHCRYLCIVRHPLDVVASVKDLVETAGHYMPELHEHLLRHDSPYDAFAAAWIDRADALAGFVERNGKGSLLVRYEDLVSDPPEVLGRIAAFMGVAPPTPDLVAAALGAPGRIGLGDWKVFERRGIDDGSVGRWRKDLPRGAAARLIPKLAPYLEGLGYPALRPARQPSREETLRQFELAMRMRLSMGPKP